ncbi:unnamed protein product [Cunninghamella echinulata]
MVHSLIPIPDNIKFEPSKDIFITSSVTNKKYHFKQSSLCDSVVQYSGYIKVTPTTKYFFWFFESRTNPDTAPLTLWLNGGPGCSSMTGLWMGVGPCNINEDGTKDMYNERGSWNKVSNMLFLDQPAGTGYSIGDIISSTKKATPLVYEFLIQFFDAFQQYQSNPFYFFGESFAGHYIPSMASYILMKNKNLSPDNQQNYINLKSVGIGNGLTSIVVQNQYIVKMACNSTYGSVLDQMDCNIMQENTPQCIQLMKKCKETETVTDCVSATNYCIRYLEDIYLRSGKSTYDVRSKDSPPYTYVNFISQNRIKELIGVPAAHTFTRCNAQVKTLFYGTGDYAKDFAPLVKDLLDQGIHVLIYAGDADFRGNWYGNYAWTQQLDFKNNTFYQSSTLHPWLDQNGREVGEFKSGGGLTFLRVYGAGHMAAAYQPSAIFDMFLKHLNGIFS